MKNKDFEERRKKIPLRIRLKVSIQIAFIDLITELGYRPNESWSPEEDELLGKLCRLADKHTEYILDEIARWEKDGKPK